MRKPAIDPNLQPRPFDAFKTPTFSYPGGKARIRSWVATYFPTSGMTYVEPFAGRGNVFFYARKNLNFKQWWLNDLNTSEFFRAIQTVDHSMLPDMVDRDYFQQLKSDRQNPISTVLEPRVTYAGKGYDYGYGNDQGSHVGYSKKHYAPMLNAAKAMLEDVKITNLPWDKLPYGRLTNFDFVYFDPPYFNTNIGSYDNIDHNELLAILKRAKFRWVLSGYDNDLYRSVIGPPVGAMERAAEIAATNGKSGQRRQECVWTSTNL